jgi:serine/threonine protein kinase
MSAAPHGLRATRPTTCPACGVERVRTEHGELCAVCLFSAGVGAPETVGSYELVQRLEAGGTGIVYIAARDDQDGFCAIKIARPELLVNDDAIAAFRNGLRIQHALHGLPGILSTRELGMHHDGRPYAVMPLLEGGTLADRELRERHQKPEAALALIIKLARAVQLAHERGVLHCDLKPENVLFSANGDPFVSDFGLARVLEHSKLARGATFAGGTRGFMSPEQVQQQELTTASDLFSLGVMLYWLLARRLPFSDGDDYERRVVEEAEMPLRKLYAGKLAWELEQICARALRKRPGQRYRSAAELVDDLERARDGRPIQAERGRPVRRAAKWMRRHNLAALAAVELCMLLVYLPLMPISVFREVKSTIREQIRFSAGAQAGAVMNELRASVPRIEELALDAEVRHLVNHPDSYQPPPELAARIAGFDGLSVFSAEGILRARFPAPIVRHPTLDFAFRDYFQGQLRNALAQKRDVYVARAFHSTGDEEPMLALSAPLYEGGKYVGFLVARTRARATFGAVQMNCGGHGSCMTALLGPRDRDHKEDPMSDSIYVLAAPGLADGQEKMLDARLAQTICARLPCQPAASNQFQPRSTAETIMVDDYEDPISHTRSMAALAPVGGTGLIVVVATPNNALDAITERMVEQIKSFLWIPLLLGLALLAAVIAVPAFNERRRAALRPGASGTR